MWFEWIVEQILGKYPGEKTSVIIRDRHGREFAPFSIEHRRHSQYASPQVILCENEEQPEPDDVKELMQQLRNQPMLTDGEWEPDLGEKAARTLGLLQERIHVLENPASNGRYTVKSSERGEIRGINAWLVYDERMQLEVFHWYGATGGAKARAVAKALNALGHEKD